MSDYFSCITSAIGTLKGPLHGGANEKAMKMLIDIGDVSKVQGYLENLLEKGEKVMGFGHRIYKEIDDPRSLIMKNLSEKLSKENEYGKYHEIAKNVENLIRDKNFMGKFNKKVLYPNVDFYCAPVYYMLGITDFSKDTPIFAAARSVGWSAHIFEQYKNNKIYRPRSKYTGPLFESYIPIDER